MKYETMNSTRRIEEKYYITLALIKAVSDGNKVNFPKLGSSINIFRNHKVHIDSPGITFV